MTYIIFQRLKEVLLYMFVIVFLGYLVNPFFESVGRFVILGICGCVLVGIPNNWIQNLPYSRKKIVALYLLESAIAAVIGLAVTALVGIIFELYSFKALLNEDEVFFFLWGALFFALGVLRACIPIKADLKKKYGNVSRKRLLWSTASFVIVVLMLHFFGDQPLLWITLALGFLVGFPIISYSGLTPPLQSLKRSRQLAAMGFGLLLVLVGTIGFLKVAVLPVSHRTDLIMELMGDVHIPLTKGRALEILKDPNIGDSKFTLDLAKKFGAEMSFSELQEKTSKCVYRDCFNLVSVISRHFDQDRRLMVFSTVLDRCSLEKHSAGYVYCRRELPVGDANEWLTLLANSKLLDSWLSSSQVHERFAAMRVLAASGANQKQLKEVKRISKSFDDISSFEARKLISINQPVALINQEKCRIDKLDKACKALKKYAL